MQTKTIIKILLDAVMAVLYILLVFDFGAGAFFHEVVGIGIGLLFLLHIALNRRCLRGLAQACAAKNCCLRKKLLLISDLILPFGMILVIGTGLLIARVLFSFTDGDLWMLIYNIHNVASYICLGILGGHMLLHLKYLVVVGKRCLQQWRESSVRRAFGGFAAVALALCLVYVVTFSVYKNKTADVSLLAGQQVSADYSSDTAADEDKQSVVAQADNITVDLSGDDTVSAAADGVTLEEYLSKLFCTGCHNHCPLTNLGCAQGNQYLEQAKIDYQQAYGYLD